MECYQFCIWLDLGAGWGKDGGGGGLVGTRQNVGRNTGREGKNGTLKIENEMKRAVKRTKILRWIWVTKSEYYENDRATLVKLMSLT